MDHRMVPQVCIASFNTKQATELTVRSARRRAGMAHRLVVGDGASTDGSVTMLERFAAKGVLELERSCAATSHPEWLDRWYRTSEIRYLVFSDSDVYYRKDGWLVDLVAEAERTRAAIIAGRIQPDWTERPRWSDGSQRRLPGARPEPCLMLLDLDQLRGSVNTSFAWHEESIADLPGKMLMFDVGGAFMRTAGEAGLRSVEMPPEFQRKYRHWGGLTWKRAFSEDHDLRLRFRQLLKVCFVWGLLVRERVIDRLDPQRVGETG